MKIVQNPDTEYANKMKRKLKENAGYCPCVLIKNNDTKCRCREFREQIENGISGSCHCGLWLAVED